eukprot:424969_1
MSAESTEQKEKENDHNKIDISQMTFKGCTVGTNNPRELISCTARLILSEKLKKNKKIQLQMYCAYNGIFWEGTKDILANRLELAQMQRKIFLPAVNDDIALQIINYIKHQSQQLQDTK